MHYRACSVRPASAGAHSSAVAAKQCVRLCWCALLAEVQPANLLACPSSLSPDSFARRASSEPRLYDERILLYTTWTKRDTTCVPSQNTATRERSSKIIPKLSTSMTIGPGHDEDMPEASLFGQ